MKPAPAPAKTNRKLADFSEVFEICDKENLNITLVGGGAVACWCQIHKNGLGSLQVTTTKDLDILGGQNEAKQLTEMLDGQFVPCPRKGGGSNIIGRILLDGKHLPLEKRRMIEVLWSVRGVSAETTKHTAIQIPVKLTGGKPTKIRLIDPLLLMEAKLANVVEIDQEDRNDIKHLDAMMKVVSLILAEEPRGKKRNRMLEKTLRLGLSDHAMKARSQHNIDFARMLTEFIQLAIDKQNPPEEGFLSSRIPQWLKQLKKADAEWGITKNYPTLTSAISETPPCHIG